MNISDSGRNAVSVHSTGAENQMVSLHTDLDFFLQFRKKIVFSCTPSTPQRNRGESATAAQSPQSCLWAEAGEDGTIRAPARHAQGVSLHTRFCRLNSHLTQESKYLGKLSCKVFVNNFCHFSCLQNSSTTSFNTLTHTPFCLTKWYFTITPQLVEQAVFSLTLL